MPTRLSDYENRRSALRRIRKKRGRMDDFFVLFEKLKIESLRIERLEDDFYSRNLPGKSNPWRNLEDAETEFVQAVLCPRPPPPPLHRRERIHS